MIGEKLLKETTPESGPTISVKQQLLTSLMDKDYRHAFVQERVRSSVALQIRSLRDQRHKMTQKELGDAIGMAQTWVSKLENPEYGKMTVSTLLRLANEFDTDLEIKFRPFSSTVDELPSQGPDYFQVRSFTEEIETGLLSQKRLTDEVTEAELREDALVAALAVPSKSTYVTVTMDTGFLSGSVYAGEPVTMTLEANVFGMVKEPLHGSLVYGGITEIHPTDFKKSLLALATTAERRAA